jgi:hypothetical protein
VGLFLWNFGMIEDMFVLRMLIWFGDTEHLCFWLFLVCGKGSVWGVFEMSFVNPYLI